MAVGWIKLHNNKPPSVYSTPSIIITMRLRKIRWVRLIALRVKVRNMHTVLVEKPKYKKPSRRTRCMYKDNIKMEHKAIGWETVDWISVDQEATQWQFAVNIVICL